jgi:hypothetical protein
MFHHMDEFFYRLRFLFGGVCVIVALILLALFITALTTSSAQAMNTTSSDSISTAGVYGDSNVVTVGIAKMAHGFGQASAQSGQTFRHGLANMGTASAHTGTFMAHAGATAVRGVGSGMLFVARPIGASVLFVTRPIGWGIMGVVHLPGRILGSVSNTQAVSAVIKPADHDPVPTINPNSPELAAARAAMVATQPAAAAATAATAAVPVSVAAQWPIHGVITTLFGVPELPYQAIHTGLDISDGKAPGTTPIHPFKPGTVSDVIHSSAGLGNHVVIDHGNGVTSVYGHLNSTAVQIGQAVDESTIIGYEGTTGVSTGTHLHFEIRVNGQATDPHNFISGQP